jgi:hypothetical protein
MTEFVTDSTGNLRITVPAGIFDLILVVEDASVDGRTLVFHLHLRPSLDTTLVLERWGSLSGRLSAPSGWTPERLEQPGLGLFDTIEAGTYFLPHVPPGTWELRLWADSAGTLRSFSLGTVTMPRGGLDLEQNLSVDMTPLLRRDFDTTMPLSAIGNCGGTKDTSCLEPATGSAAWSGTSLRISMPDMPGMVDTAWLWPRSSPDSTVSVGPRDSLSFMARGTGNLQLWLGDAGTLSVAVELTPRWQRYAFAVSDLIDGTSSQAVKKIGIASSGQMYLVLDDLIFTTR